MKFQPILVVIVTVAVAGTAAAGNLTIPKTFVTGETARASEVNDNFTAIKTEVDDNNARINQNESAMSFKQERVSGSCPAGQYMRVINSDGTVSCELDVDSNTTYSAGNGLNLNGTEFETNSAVVQNRVIGICAAGESIRVINADGTVVCEVDSNDDNDTTYSNGTGLNLTGTVFSVNPATTQSRVTGSCPADQSINVIKQDGTVTCEADTDTTYSILPDGGLQLNAGVFSVDTNQTQTRVNMECDAGSSIRVIKEDGSVVCQEFTASAGSGLDFDPATGVITTDSAVLQKRLPDTNPDSTCSSGDYMTGIEDDGTAICETDKDTTYTADADDGLNLDAATKDFSIDSAKIQQRVSNECDPNEFMWKINETGIAECEEDDDTQYTADANGFRGITLEGNEFRLSDGYVSVPYSAFVATNVSRTDAQALDAYPKPLSSVESIYGWSPFLNPVVAVFNTEIAITNADHPQLQVCQLAHQMSETEAYTYMVNNGNANCDAFAPLSLPHNAYIENLSCKVYDNSASNTLQVKLVQVPLTDNVSSSAQDEILSSNVSDTLSAPQEISVTSSSTTQIQNNLYAYHLKMIWENNALGSNYRIYGCSIGYSY